MLSRPGTFGWFVVILTTTFLLIVSVGGYSLLRIDRDHEVDVMTADIAGRAIFTARSIARHVEHHDDAHIGALVQDFIAPLAVDRAVVCAEYRPNMSVPPLATVPQGSGCGSAADIERVSVPVGALGSLTIGFTFAYLDQALADRRSRLAFVLVVGLLAAAIAAVAGYRKFVGARVRRLLASIERQAATGEFVAVADGSQDDIGGVLKAFDAMSAKEAERKAKIERINADLEGQVRERNAALERNQVQMAYLLEHTTEGFWFIDNDGLTVDVNPAMCRILARSKDEILGRTIYDFVDETNKLIFESELEKRRNGVANAYEISLSRPDGSLAPCLNKATALYDANGKKTGSVGMWTDITSLKETERQLVTAKEAAEAASEAKSAFLATMTVSQLLNHWMVEAFGQRDAYLATIGS